VANGSPSVALKFEDPVISTAIIRIQLHKSTQGACPRASRQDVWLSGVPERDMSFAAPITLLR